MKKKRTGGKVWVVLRDCSQVGHRLPAEHATEVAQEDQQLGATVQLVTQPAGHEADSADACFQCFRGNLCQHR